jgi:drug/metabolite transporter (DMT)-like permease
LAQCAQASAGFVLAVAMLAIEFALIAPLLAVTWPPPGIGLPTAWVLLGGIGHFLGLALAAMSYQHLQASVVAAVLSCEGAVAALLAIATGEAGGLALIPALVLVTVGVGATLRADARDLPADQLPRGEVPLAVGAGTWRLPARALSWLVGAGLADVGGYLLFALGSRDSIGVTALLAAQFPSITAVLAAVAFGERLTGGQIAGIGFVGAGASLLVVAKGV